MNLFGGFTLPLQDELFTPMLQQPGCRIERIVSNGHASPPGFWYDQNEGEWVTVLQGRAELEFTDGRIVTLSPGDCCDIPPHCRHRVRATDLSGPTVWLAVFYLPS